MQLSDREIQKTLDLFRKRQAMGQQEGARVLSAEEIEGIRQVVKKIDKVPPIRQDRVEKVRRALESSSYNVTCDDVAKELIGRVISDKLIQSEVTDYAAVRDISVALRLRSPLNR